MCGEAAIDEGVSLIRYTTKMRLTHRGTRDSVSRAGSSVPGGEDVETRSKDIDALSKVGEVGSLISDRGSTDGDGVLGGSWRVGAGVSVVVTSSDGEVETGLDSSVDSEIERGRLATSERHVLKGEVSFNVEADFEQDIQRQIPCEYHCGQPQSASWR